jgi:hypothetical protein
MASPIIDVIILHNGPCSTVLSVFPLLPYQVLAKFFNA